MILNTQDPAESDLTIKTAPVLWLVRAHSAPGTAAPELSRTATRNELETFCASAILTAQARITTNNILNFFIEAPVSAGNPKPAVWSPDEDPSHSQDFEPVKQLKRSIYPKSRMQDKSTPIRYCFTRGQSDSNRFRIHGCAGGPSNGIERNWEESWLQSSFRRPFGRLGGRC